MRVLTVSRAVLTSFSVCQVLDGSRAAKIKHERIVFAMARAKKIRLKILWRVQSLQTLVLDDVGIGVELWVVVVSVLYGDIVD